MPAAGPPGEVRDLGHGIYQLPTDYPDVCNAPLWTYLLADTGRFGLVDPGIASTREATLTAAIQQAGFTLGQADILLATHGHPDHSGGQGTWRGVAPAARIAAPLEDTAWVESFDKQWNRFWDDYPGIMDLRDTRDFLAGLCRPEPRVDVLLRDGDTVTVGARLLSVVETRGTPGDTVPISTRPAACCSPATQCRVAGSPAATVPRCSRRSTWTSRRRGRACGASWTSRSSCSARPMSRPCPGPRAWLSCETAFRSSTQPIRSHGR